MQCRGHRGNGESFTADVWFSTYKEGTTPKLAAIIADVTEETLRPAPIHLHSELQERPLLTDREMRRASLLGSGPGQQRNSDAAWRSRRAPSRTRCSNSSPRPTCVRARNWFARRWNSIEIFCELQDAHRNRQDYPKTSSWRCGDWRSLPARSSQVGFWFGRRPF